MFLFYIDTKMSFFYNNTMWRYKKISKWEDSVPFFFFSSNLHKMLNTAVETFWPLKYEHCILKPAIRILLSDKLNP